MYAGALFIQLALQWNIYLAVVLLLSITALYTVAGELPPDFIILHIACFEMTNDHTCRECILCPVCHWLLLVISQVGWLQSSTQMLLKLLSCWPDHSPSWSSVSNNATTHRALITTLYRLTLPSLCWGFVEVGGWNALMEGYGNAIPSVRVPNSTCGIPRDDAFHIFRDPVSSDLPWPGTLIGMSIPSMWYWCSDQVQAWKVCVTQTSQSKHSIQLWFRLKFKLDILLVAW